MSGMPLETCRAFNKFWNNKFYYKVASCWLFLLIHKQLTKYLQNGSAIDDDNDGDDDDDDDDDDNNNNNLMYETLTL